jgi:hypothetical protein
VGGMTQAGYLSRVVGPLQQQYCDYRACSCQRQRQLSWLTCGMSTMPVAAAVAARRTRAGPQRVACAMHQQP